MRGLLVAEGPLRVPSGQALRVPSGQALREPQGERNRELTLRGMSECGVSRLWPAVRLFLQWIYSWLGAFQLQIQNSFCRGKTTPPLSGAEPVRSSRRTARARGAVARKWRRCAVPWGEGSRGVGVGARGSCQGGSPLSRAGGSRTAPTTGVGRTRARVMRGLLVVEGLPSSALRTGFDRLRANGFGRGAYNGEWGMRWGVWWDELARGVGVRVGARSRGRAVREPPLRPGWGARGRGCARGLLVVEGPLRVPSGQASTGSGRTDLGRACRGEWGMRWGAFARWIEVLVVNKHDYAHMQKTPAPGESRRASPRGGEEVTLYWANSWGKLLGSSPLPAGQGFAG